MGITECFARVTLR